MRCFLVRGYFNLILLKHAVLIPITFYVNLKGSWLGTSMERHFPADLDD